MKKLWILLCTHERCKKTKECLDSLLSGVPQAVQPRVVAVDAGSRDGTVRMLSEYEVNGGSLKLLERGSELYWNASMRIAMNYAYHHCKPGDYVCLVNDDVRFLPGALSRMVERLHEYKADAVAGAMRDSKGVHSYGGVRCLSRRLARFELIPPSPEPASCDTFNCNCLLLKAECFMKHGNLDAAYTHSMGDYDYGLRLSRAGCKVINTADYVGECDDNETAGSWRDASLSMRERLALKESAKGLPARDWFHFVKKNYGMAAALYHSATPYLRILLHK